MIFTILKFFLVLIFGISFTLFIRFKGDWIERLGLSLLLGPGIISIVYFLFIWKTDRVISTDFWLITFSLTFLMLTMFYFLTKPKLIFRKIVFSKIIINTNLVTTGCWTIIAILLVASFINTFYTPVHTTDSLILFDFRSKVMFISQKLVSIKIITGWQNYPMFTSMIGLMARFLGTDNPSFYYPTMYFSFALIFYSILRKSVGKNLASIGTLFMYTTPITLWQSQLDGMTNIPYAIFLCLSILYIYKIMISEKPRLSDVIISSIFLGLSSWTRGIEPLWMIPLFLILAVSFFRNRRFLPVVYFLIFFPIKQVWPQYVGEQYTTITTAGKIIVNAISRSPVGRPTFYEVFMHVATSMYTLIIVNLGPVVYLFLIIFISDFFLRKYKSQIFYLFTIGGLLLVLFVGSLYMAINFDFEVSVFNGSLSRLLSIFPPLMWFYIIISPVWSWTINRLKLKRKLNTSTT